MARSYRVLIRQIPVLKTLMDKGDDDALENLYRNVSDTQAALSEDPTLTWCVQATKRF